MSRSRGGPDQRPGVSYGIAANGTTGYLTAATPGADNTGSNTSSDHAADADPDAAADASAYVAADADADATTDASPDAAANTDAKLVTDNISDYAADAASNAAADTHAKLVANNTSDCAADPKPNVRAHDVAHTYSSTTEGVLQRRSTSKMHRRYPPVAPAFGPARRRGRLVHVLRVRVWTAALRRHLRNKAQCRIQHPLCMGCPPFDDVPYSHCHFTRAPR